jgi:hypothetical protein
VVAADEVDLFGVDAFEGEEEADSLEGVAAAVHEIAQEDVVEVLDVFLFALFVGRAVEGEETHEVRELPVDVSEYLQGGFRLQDDRLAHDDLFRQVAEGNDLLRFEGHLEGLRVHEVVGLHEHVEVFDGDVHFVAQGFGLEAGHWALVLLVADHWVQQLYPFLLL